jgi:hypothetical protein
MRTGEGAGTVMVMDLAAAALSIDGDYAHRGRRRHGWIWQFADGLLAFADTLVDSGYQMGSQLQLRPFMASFESTSCAQGKHGRRHSDGYEFGCWHMDCWHSQIVAVYQRGSQLRHGSGHGLTHAAGHKATSTHTLSLITTVCPRGFHLLLIPSSSRQSQHCNNFTPSANMSDIAQSAPPQDHQSFADIKRLAASSEALTTRANDLGTRANDSVTRFNTEVDACEASFQGLSETIDAVDHCVGVLQKLQERTDAFNGQLKRVVDVVQDLLATLDFMNLITLPNTTHPETPVEVPSDSEKHAE